MALRHIRSMGFPDNSIGKEFACNAGDPVSIPRSGRSTGEGIVYPLQYSWAFLVVQERMAGKESTCNVGDLGSIPGLGRSPGEEKDTHSSILAWRIPWTVYPWGSKESDVAERLSLSGEQAQVWFGNNILYGHLKLPTGIINEPTSQITAHPSSFYISVVPLLVLWINAFELRYWKRLLRFSWTARGSNQSVLKDINPDSLEGLTLSQSSNTLATCCKEMASSTQFTWVWANSRR